MGRKGLQAREGGQVALTMEMFYFFSWIMAIQVFPALFFSPSLCLKYFITDFFLKSVMSPPRLPIPATDEIPCARQIFEHFPYHYFLMVTAGH